MNNVAPSPARRFFRNPDWQPFLWSLAIFGTLLGVIEVLGLDRPISHALFYDSVAHQWLGGGSGAWWARDLIHSGGRDMVRMIAAGALVAWLLSYVFPALASWRREARYVFLGMVLVTGLVGLLKQLTNVDCPWDLAEFGGSRPYVTLFGDRPDYLPRAQCFPGAHSSSGFALMSLYFALRERRALLARWLLAGAVLVGVIFALGQQARGAHFLSHDLTSAMLAWWLLLALRNWLLKPGAAPVNAGAAQLASSLRRWGILTGILLPAEIPDDGAHHDHRDADAIAHARAPVVDPAQQSELAVHEVKHE